MERSADRHRTKWYVEGESEANESQVRIVSEIKKFNKNELIIIP